MRTLANRASTVFSLPFNGSMTDISGNSLNGSISVGSELYDVLDGCTQAFAFKQLPGLVDTAVILPSSSLYRFTGEFTIHFIIKPIATSTQTILQCETPGGAVLYALYIDPGVRLAYAETGVNAFIGFPSNPIAWGPYETAGVPIAMCLRKRLVTGTTYIIELFIDGVKQTGTLGATLQTAAGTERIRIGGWVGATNYLREDIANMRADNVALSDAQVAADATWLMAGCLVPPTAAIVSPDAGSSTETTSLIFNVTASEGFTTATASITDSVVTGATAWSLAGGFASGYYGTASAITDGYQVVLNRTGGWRTGALTLALAVTDTLSETASASRSWTMGASAPGTTTAAYIADPLRPLLDPFYYLKITGIPYYFFAIIDPTDAKWGDAQWTLGAGYTSVKGMNVPSDTFDQALPDLIGGVASAERITLSMMDFNVVDANGPHSFFGRLLSPGRVTTNTSAILGTLNDDLSASTTTGPDLFVLGAGGGGAFGAQDTFLGGETLGVNSVSGPDGAGVYTLTISQRNKYPCNAGYPPTPGYIVPLDQDGNVVADQTVLVSQGDPISFVNRSAALYIGHMTPDGRPEPEVNALCRMIGHVKGINYGQSGTSGAAGGPGTFQFVLESVISDITTAKIAPNLAHGDIHPALYLSAPEWRTLTVYIEVAYSPLSDGFGTNSRTIVLDDGGLNQYEGNGGGQAAIYGIRDQFNSQQIAEGPLVVDTVVAGGHLDCSIRMYVAAGGDGQLYAGISVDSPYDSRITVSIYVGLQSVPGQPRSASAASLMGVLGFSGGVQIPQGPAPTDTSGLTHSFINAPRSAPICFVPTSVLSGGTAIALRADQVANFFTDQGDGSGTAYVRYGDGQTATVLATDAGASTITVGSSGIVAAPSNPALPRLNAGNTCYYVEAGGSPSVDQIVRIPSAATGSVERGVFQLLASTGSAGDGEFNVFPGGIGLGWNGILDKASLRNAGFRFTSSFATDIDSTMLFSDIWTGLAKAQGMFLVWDPALSQISLRILALANFATAASFQLTDSNRAAVDDFSQATIDTTNLRTGWLIRYGWDPIQKKFLAPELTINDAYASLAYQIASRTETIEDRTIPLSQTLFVNDAIVPALADRGVFTRYPWMSVTRSVNKTGLLLSPGQYYQIADATLFNPFTGLLGITLNDNIFAWMQRVQSELDTGLVTATFLVDQTIDQSLLRPWSPTGLLNFGNTGNGYNNTTGVCSMGTWYSQIGADGIDFKVGDKIALTPRDCDGAPAYYKAGTISAIDSTGNNVTIDAGLGAISTTVETIMVLQDWGSQITDRKSGPGRVSFQGSGDTLLIAGTTRLHKWT